MKRRRHLLAIFTIFILPELSTIITGKPQQQEVPIAVDQNINIKIPPPILPPTFISQQPQQQVPEFVSQPPQNAVGQVNVAEYPNYEDYADDYNYINNDAANTAGVNNDKALPPPNAFEPQPNFSTVGDADYQIYDVPKTVPDISSDYNYYSDSSAPVEAPAQEVNFDYYNADVSQPAGQQGADLNTADEEQLCHVVGGDSNVVLDIDESIGNDFSQSTTPKQLPIYGLPGSNIQLELVAAESGQAQYFVLAGNQLRLSQPLDRDADDLSSLVLQVTCTVLGTGKRRTIPVIVKVSDLNDNTPRFMNTPYTVDIEEDAAINSVVFRGIKAEDPDSGPRGLVQYRIIPGDGSVSDGYGVFAIDLPHQGIITVVKKLDFETVSRYYLTLEARDQAPAGQHRSETTIMTINVRDSDDLGPEFTHSLYTASISRAELSGALDVQPEKLEAQDGDSLRAEMSYQIVSGKPEDYKEYFKIDRRTGVVRQIKEVGSDSIIERFELTVQAEEKTRLRKRKETKLIINVNAVDAFPPVLSISAEQGFVTENSPIGTVLKDKDGNPVVFTVTDQDLGPEPRPKEDYRLEFTTDQFSTNSESELIVNLPSLDRDPPGQPMLMLQVVAREVRNTGKSSNPLTLRINIGDENDNPPFLPSFPPFTIPPGDGRRVIVNLNATDVDENDTIKYKITDVSNGGKRAFYVNPNTGDLEVIGAVQAGESYRITVTAKDSAEAQSETTIDVNISQGPNLRPPRFEKAVYDAQVSEGASRYTTIARVLAVDPESSSVTYSISSGNAQGHFSIEESSGVIRVNSTLDREDTRRYTLVILAEDEGGMTSTATVNIIVTDINDENPIFQNTPYNFRVKEGEVGAMVGKVFAEDKDTKENANISYSIDDNKLFEIDPYSGEINTKTALDFETGQVHYVAITAKDGAKEPRIATATATVLVQDISDEVPYFPESHYEAVVPENIKDFLVVKVTAIDKDTVSMISYRIMSGALEEFRIDPLTGEIFTIKGLDYERRKVHELVIGSEQGMLHGSEEGNTTTTLVKIMVQDVNDMAPEFTSVPTGNTLYVRNDAKIHDIVGKVQAADTDGTEPGNLVRYSLDVEASSPSAETYFRVDTQTGDIILLGDLSNEVYEEYKLSIKAMDQGTPSLQANVDIIVRVEQVVTLPPNTGVGFNQLTYQIQVMENTPQEAVLKTLPLVDIPEKNIRISCSVTSARDKNGKDVSILFRGEMNQANQCNLILARSVLDFESMPEYRVKVRVNTLTAFINPKRAEAEIKLEIVDKNDNSPKFIYNNSYNTIIKDKYLKVLSLNTKPGSEVLQVLASDSDSGNFGTVFFELATDTDPVARQYFKVDGESGIVRTKKDFSDVDPDDLPFKLIINARDNPGDMENSKMDKTEAVINLLQKQNLFVIVLKGTKPNEVKSRFDDLGRILSDQSEMIVNIDRAVEAQVRDDNGTCCLQSKQDTDVWFYAIDPATQTLLALNESMTVEKITGKQASTSLKYIVTGDLHVQASDIHEVYVEDTSRDDPTATSVKTLYNSQYSGYPAVLIAIGCIVFASSIIAITYILILYNRYQKAKDSTEQMIVVPRYEPVFVEPNMKLYETQVLQMSVNMDEPDDLRIDFKNRSANRYVDPGFNLDNVSYITHDTTSTSGSPVQDTSLSTFRAATVSGRPGRPISRSQSSLRPNQPSQPLRLTPPHSNGAAHHPSGATAVFSPEEQNLIFHGRSDFNTSTPKRSHSFKAVPQNPDATTQL